MTTDGKLDVTKSTKKRGDLAPGAASEAVPVPSGLAPSAHEPEHRFARIRVNKGATINIGRMEFLRCDVAVELPCKPDLASLDRAIDIADTIANDRLVAEIENARKQSGGGDK